MRVTKKKAVKGLHYQDYILLYSFLLQLKVIQKNEAELLFSKLIVVQYNINTCQKNWSEFSE